MIKRHFLVFVFLIFCYLTAIVGKGIIKYICSITLALMIMIGRRLFYFFIRTKSTFVDILYLDLETLFFKFNLICIIKSHFLLPCFTALKRLYKLLWLFLALLFIARIDWLFLAKWLNIITIRLLFDRRPNVITVWLFIEQLNVITVWLLIAQQLII